MVLKNMSRKHKRIIGVITIVFVLAAAVTVYAAAIQQVRIAYDGNTISVYTRKATVGEVLDEQRIVLGEFDRVVPASETAIKGIEQITVKRAVPVSVVEAGEARQYLTAADTVKEFLDDAGIVLGGDDMLSARLEDSVAAGMELIVTRVTKEIREETIAIPYETQKRANADMDKGTSRTVQAGAEGSKVQKIEVLYCDGVEQDSTVVEETVVAEPVAAIVEYGTKDRVITSRGDNFRYSKVLTCTATAYDLSYESTGKYPGQPGHGITATGTYCKKGTVAVDPRVIPLGSRLYIEADNGSWTYGYAVAEDTGGAIKGNKVDLFFHTAEEVRNFGRRTAKVYILE